LLLLTALACGTISAFHEHHFIILVLVIDSASDKEIRLRA